ncbi:hypothetical protein BHE74_00043066 [Ensete ventricosum]|nr:hypothetical protein BHE74_00043066 [Ensete ventricosum]
MARRNHVAITCNRAIKIDTHLLKHPPHLLIERTVMRVLLSRADACNRWQAATPGSRAVASGPAVFVVWSHLDHSNASILPPSAWKAEAKEGLLLPRKLPSFPSFETHLWKPPAMNLMASSRASCSKEQQKIYQQWFAVADKGRHLDPFFPAIP